MAGVYQRGGSIWVAWNPGGGCTEAVPDGPNDACPPVPQAVLG